MTPILTIIPYWSGDEAKCIELCRLLVGLQTNHARQDCHVMLARRKDCKEDPNIAKIISQRFNTFTFQCTSNLKGWPSGPNGMFGSSMIYVCNAFKNKYECVYWMETDCIPIKPLWHQDLVHVWRSRHPKANIVGHRSDCNGDGTGDHITGCALYHPNIARILPKITLCDNGAWDYVHRASIVAMGQHTSAIQNRYNERNVPPGVIEEPGLVIIHGTKDNCVINAVKAKYKIQ